MKEIKIGDLVQYKCSNTGRTMIGLVADVFDDDKWDYSPHPLYEVVSVEPPDRVWLSAYEFSMLNPRSKN